MQVVCPGWLSFVRFETRRPSNAELSSNKLVENAEVRSERDKQELYTEASSTDEFAVIQMSWLTKVDDERSVRVTKCGGAC